MSEGGPLPYFQFWQKAYLSSAKLRSLSLAGHGLLLLFQLYQWEDGNLPNDPKALRRMVGADAEEFDSAWEEVKNLLVSDIAEIDGGCRLVYAPLAAQRTETIAKCTMLQANGKLGGRPKSDSKTGRKPKGKPLANQKLTKRVTKSKAKPEPNIYSPSEPTVHPPRGTEAGKVTRADFLFDLLPESHKSPELHEAIRQNFQMRKEKHKKPLTETGLRQKASEYSKYDASDVIAALNHATANDYDGVFIKPQNGGRSNSSQPVLPKGSMATQAMNEILEEIRNGKT